MKILKQRPYLLGDEMWVCPNHLPSLKMPLVCETCWMCDNRRPRTRQEHQSIRVVHVSSKNDPYFCAWEKCDKGPNGTRAKSREKSKYCSTYCKNAYARHRHKLRQQNT